MIPLFSSPTAKEWQKIGIKQHHGIVIPLFSLHSNQSCGIGEFPDLLPLVPWCQSIGYDVIQLLPLNDTGPESSPYSALSAFALNPIHLGLASLPFLDEFPELQPLLIKMQTLNNTQRVNYQDVLSQKESFLKKYYQKIAPKITSQSTFHQFLTDNPWLEEYALFKALKVALHWSPWETWPPLLNDPSIPSYIELLQQYADDIHYHIFVQYLCFQQLKQVKAVANQHSVFLKGDIPILISNESADVWLHRPLFNMEVTAGAPPDVYSKEGQNWKFPIYNWEATESQIFEWWKLRLQVAGNFYNIYRIDHIVGFFRIWSIPLNGLAKDGKFIPENPGQWLPQGEKILRLMIASSEMLPIGEDLGIVPTDVRQAIFNLGICGTKVMRWERRWNEDKQFIDPKDYSPISMTTVSTHDSDTILLWWKNCPDEAKDYAKYRGWKYNNDLSWEQQYSILQDSHHSGSLFHINLLNEYLSLVPNMSWPNPEDERINVPGVISDRNWTYRFRPSVEEIVSSAALTELMKGLVRPSLGTGLLGI